MMEPLNGLRSQWKTAHIKGKADEHIAISRAEKSNSQVNYNFTVKLVVKRKTQMTLGDFITIENEDYFVIGKIDTQVKLRRTNCTIDIVKIKKHFNTSKANDYDYEVPVYTGITAFYEDITGKMQQFDSGLKVNSTKKFLVPKIAIDLTDRIKINGNNGLVEAVNESSYPGLLSIQTSNDTRPTKIV